jgi:chromosome segregation ATPase
MVQPGIGLDTPKTNFGDATYLTNHNLDFDISQEMSFQSPSKDNNNLLQQLQNGRRGGAINLKTPRSRAALVDRRNIPGGEFTPLLKSATRNNALKIGKENVPQTPAFLKSGGLENIPEDFSPLPQMGSSVYERDSRNGSYISGTPMPQLQTSSAASTPMALLPRRNEGPGVLQDGNQLSLREQENVIDKIEKENFGLKLKIHFLEEALRKAGPGFSEAALKENTELKVDKVTMQKELHRYKKTLASAERDVELFRQQMIEMQEKIKRKHADAGQLEELDRLRRGLAEKEDALSQLRGQETQLDDLQDKIHDLEAELREKDRLLDDHEDEAENMKDEIAKKNSAISELEQSLKKSQRREIELEEDAQASEELAAAKETIQDLERDLERLKQDVEDAKEDCQEAMNNKERAEADLEELQDEMANKSVTTKGLSRQIEEKANRLQDELEDLREKYLSLEEEYENKSREVKKVNDALENLRRDGDVREQKLKDKLEIVDSDKQTIARERSTLATKLEATQKDLQHLEDEKNLLQIRHDALTLESASLQRDLTKSQKVVEDLEDKLDHEKTLALTNEREVRDQYKVEIDRLNDEIEDLQAEAREKQLLYDQDSDKWDSERRNLHLQKESAEEKVSGLQRTIDKLQQAEGNLSSKESKFQQALETEKERHEGEKASLVRQIDELNEDVQSHRETLNAVRSELAVVQEELRLSHREEKSLLEKVEGLEDEVEILQTSLDDETDRYNEEISSATQESESLRRQLQILKQDYAHAESANAYARAEAEAFQGDLQAEEGSKQQLSTRLREVEAQLFKVREEKQTLKNQVATLSLEVGAIRTAKADAEAERDEVKNQLRMMKQQDEDTFRLDQERVDLRTAKMKLDSEIRRLREENKSAVATKQTLEKELQEEIDRANIEEARLNSEVQDLQRILRGSSEKKDLAAARKTIQHLENRIHELQNQISSEDNNTEATSELAMLRRDLSAARSKETDYLQREAIQKEAIRGLKHQISDLERQAHNAEVSRLAISSPQSSHNGSARKSELADVRRQLSTAHETLKDLRSQLKNAEKDASRKLNAANIDLQEKSEEWESEKDQLERSLDEALLKKNQLAAQNNTAEATISRLRGKIDRLEQALQAERLNTGEDRTIALERRDLHEMLRESQVQVESLELVVKERESIISNINAAAEKMSKNISRVREERDAQKMKAESAKTQLRALELKLKDVTEAWETKRHLENTDNNVSRLREERDMHRAKADASGKRLADLELKLKDFSNVKATADKMKTNIDRIRVERDDLRAHVERSHVRIATLEADINKAIKGWEAEKQLSKDASRLRKERNELLSAHKSHEEQLTQLELQFNGQTTTAGSERYDTEIRRVREERDRLRAQAESTSKQLETLDLKFQEANEAWDLEKLTLTRGVRFPHMSISINEDEVQLLNQIEILKAGWSEKESHYSKITQDLEIQVKTLKGECSAKDSRHSKAIRDMEMRMDNLKEEWSEKERHHSKSIREREVYIEVLKGEVSKKDGVSSKNLRGLQMQVDWWRAKCDREAMFRDMGTYAKKYMKLQIEMFEAW